MNSEERCADCPDKDASKIKAIEISFSIPVYMTQDQQGRLIRIVDDIIDQPWNAPKDGVHWMAEVGAKPNWSQIDAAFLGQPVDPNAPKTGEPTFDDGIFTIASYARGFVTDKERERVEKRRLKPKTEFKDEKTLALQEILQWCVSSKNMSLRLERIERLAKRALTAPEGT